MKRNTDVILKNTS